jgi:hypothetical protein
MKQHKEIPSKRIYRAPKFRLYGNIRELTHSVGKRGAMDGGGPKSLNKTMI